MEPWVGPLFSNELDTLLVVVVSSGGPLIHRPSSNLTVSVFLFFFKLEWEISFHFIRVFWSPCLLSCACDFSRMGHARSILAWAINDHHSPPTFRLGGFFAPDLLPRSESHFPFMRRGLALETERWLMLVDTGLNRGNELATCSPSHRRLTPLSIDSNAAPNVGLDAARLSLLS